MGITSGPIREPPDTLRSGGTPPMVTSRPRVVALIGNPNTGKSTLFGALVGIHQHVGNYPGVTVEKKTGRMEYKGQAYELIDLPGLYSLAARSRDEMVAVDVLLERQRDVGPVDAVLCIVDACNLQRHFYLASQVLELGLPTVIVVNMVDVAANRGVTVDVGRLQERLGVPVVAIQANRGTGLPQLKSAMAAVLRRGACWQVSLFPAAFECEVSGLESALAADGRCSECVRPCGGCPGGAAEAATSPKLPRCLVRRLLLDTSGYVQQAMLWGANGPLCRHLEAARARLAEAGCPVPAIETSVRYDWARSILHGAVTEPGRYRFSATDRIDRLLTHRFWGTLVFAAVMLVVFQSVFNGARPLMKAIQMACELVGGWVGGTMAEGALRSLLVEGLIDGVGSVLAFLPQILILFFFIAVLEDCGYMARAAYLMDRLMSRVGLSGRSFIPMLSSFACAVPGIMAARVIENERDRLTTILVAPLLTCSARLPVYALLIAAFLPAETYLGGLLSLQGLTLAGLYALGIVAAVVVALLLKRTILRGQTPPFLMELPGYKWPSPRTVVLRVVERGWLFLRTAGTLILAISVIVWAAAYYPHDGDPRHSILGRLGQVIEPAVAPLGWDWHIGCAVLASLPAREVVVATLGVVYGLEKDIDPDSAEGFSQLQARLRNATWEGTDRPVFTIPVALSLMVFYALCAQCAATLAVIRRETNSWRWPLFTFTYMTVLAYFGALITYQLGTWLSAFV